ncbi:MAG: hypothetical protein LBV47_08660 [Bacteroidales bacterium]|jgi:hypothetical protein|nr:hypothetical protein [Bacteroidales bacterium]
MTKSERVTSITLAFILLLTVINSTWYFLGIAKVSFVQWIVFNACAPSSIVSLLGLFIFFRTKNRIWLSIAMVPMMFFGTMGLFVFPWNSANDLLVQFSHIVMTINIAYGLWITLKNRDYKALGNGLLASVLTGIPFIAFTQQYCRIHAEEVIKILGI